MAAILLIDVRETISSELAQFLRSRQHSVSVRPTAGGAIKDLRASQASYDVIILNMSHKHAKDWKALEEIHQFFQFSPTAPPVLCISTVYWGRECNSPSSVNGRVLSACNKFATLLQNIEFVLTERKELRSVGPHLTIWHRF
jgi:hypothetical protein